LNRNLLANGARYANRYGVRNAYGNSLADLDGLLLAYRCADRVRNLLRNVLAYVAANGVSLSLALRNHSAGTVANVLGALLANPATRLVAYGPRAAFRNHFASRVVNGLGAWLANHFASRVVDRLASALRNHFASRVVDRLAAWLADHSANLVANRLASALGYHFASRVVNRLAALLANRGANRVRNCLANAFTLVTSAVDYLGFAGWNPNLLANRPWWALYGLCSACAGTVYALALGCIPNPCTRLANGAALDRTRNCLGVSIPVSALDLYRSGKVYRLGDVTNNFTSSGLLMRNPNGVVDDSAVLFTNRVHDRVVDDSGTSLVYRATNGVVDHLAVILGNPTHNRVVNNLAMILIDGSLDGVVNYPAVRFTYWTHDGVVNLLRVCLVHRSADSVVYLSRVCLIHRLHNCVLTRLGLAYRPSHCMVDRTVTRFSLHASHVDYLVFCHRLIFGARTLLGSLFVNRASYCFHDCVRSWNFTAICHTTTTILVANRSAIGGVSFPGN